MGSGRCQVWVKRGGNCFMSPCTWFDLIIAELKLWYIMLLILLFFKAIVWFLILFNVILLHIIFMWYYGFWEMVEPMSINSHVMKQSVSLWLVCSSYEEYSDWIIVIPEPRLFSYCLFVVLLWSWTFFVFLKGFSPVELFSCFCTCEHSAYYWLGKTKLKRKAGIQHPLLIVWRTLDSTQSWTLTDIIITWHSWLVLSCISSQWAHCSIFKYLAFVCCSSSQHTSETFHLTQLHLYWSALRWFMYAIWGLFICVIYATAVFPTCSQQHVFIFLFSNLADAFIQSDLQMRTL